MNDFPLAICHFRLRIHEDKLQPCHSRENGNPDKPLDLRICKDDMKKYCDDTRVDYAIN